jgi:hypothetical protein
VKRLHLISERSGHAIRPLESSAVTNARSSPGSTTQAGIRSLTGGLHLMQRFLYSAIDLVKSLHCGFLFLKKARPAGLASPS